MLCPVQLVSLGSLLFLKGNGEVVILGERGVVGRTGSSGSGETVARMYFFQKRINKKENKGMCITFYISLLFSCL